MTGELSGGGRENTDGSPPGWGRFFERTALLRESGWQEQRSVTFRDQYSKIGQTYSFAMTDGQHFIVYDEHWDRLYILVFGVRGYVIEKVLLEGNW